MRWNTNLTLYQALAEDRAIALRGRCAARPT